MEEGKQNKTKKHLQEPTLGLRDGAESIQRKKEQQQPQNQQLLQILGIFLLARPVTNRKHTHTQPIHTTFHSFIQTPL